MRVCVICGDDMEGHHGLATVCSEACRQQRKNARRRKAPELKFCIVCDEVFSSANAKELMCSNECATRRRLAKCNARYHRTKHLYSAEKQCVICDVSFSARNSRHKTCSAHCSREMKLRQERERKPVGSRAAPKPCLECEHCGETFEACRRDARFCSNRCHYAAQADVRRQRCRSWRERHPDRQAASTKRWEANNPEKVRERGRINSQKWRDRNPGLKAAQSRTFRAKYPHKAAEYQSKRVAAYRLYRMIETYGIAALSPSFKPPAKATNAIKQSESGRKWRARNPNYKPPTPRELRLSYQRKHSARETAAVKLIREIETKGLEALL